MSEKLTENDIKKIQAEINERKFTLRPKLLEDVKETRAQGDLSENFEYHEAKRAKNRNDSRIRYLENVLRHAVVVSDASVEGQVGLNNTVTLYFPEDDLTEAYKMVTSIRGNSLENKISPESPLGAAIFGRHVGETVTVHVNNDISYDVTIQAIDQTSTDEGDEIKSF